jgi:radical SAM-linked protein
MRLTIRVRLGCHFDGWSESFDFDKWLNAAEKTGIDLYQYAARTYDFSSELPWDFIDTGVTKKFLRSEYEKSIKKETTIDCRYLCSRCGLECREEPGKKKNVIRETRRTRHNKDFLQYDRFPLSPVHTRHVTQRPLHSIRVRIKFSKTGILRYLSHREVITAFSRALRRAHVPLFYSEGFHPHPKISFGPPLPVGVEGINEYFDVELPASSNHADILPQINASLPEGLKVHSATHVHKKGKALNDFISRYEYEIIIDKTMNESIHSFIGLQKYMVTREKKVVDIRPMVERTDINNGSLNLTLVDTAIFKVRLYELLGALLQKPVKYLQTVPIRRVFLYGHHENKRWVDPVEEAIHEQ